MCIHSTRFIFHEKLDLKHMFLSFVSNKLKQRNLEGFETIIQILNIFI